MEKKLVVLDADNEQCTDLCEILKEEHYIATPVSSIKHLENHLQERSCKAVIMDIDTVPVNNRTVRKLTSKYPGVNFLCLSKARFHPELKDAISHHMYACIKKPPDPDELFYWINSIYEDSEV